MEFRNPKYNAAGTIDVEINHPQFGWIPFSASSDDDTVYGPAIFAEASAGVVEPYVPPENVPTIPESVSARQFKLQLLASGLLDAVESFVSAQSRAVQIAYENSGSFVRTEPMMLAGFTALGFDDGQIDAFFVAASGL